jgi:hypothetical protein
LHNSQHESVKSQQKIDAQYQIVRQIQPLATKLEQNSEQEIVERVENKNEATDKESQNSAKFDVHSEQNDDETMAKSGEM